MTHDTALVEELLSAAIALRDASLVVFRRDVLVEFKTERLRPALAIDRHGTHRSWQIGPADGHHCHLNLAAVAGVLFDAEAVSCQRGRINYTVWFLAALDCGNPYRPDGLFSVTLNAPYAKNGSAREDVIVPLLALHARFADRPGVAASEAFLRQCHEFIGGRCSDIDEATASTKESS